MSNLPSQKRMPICSLAKFTELVKAVNVLLQMVILAAKLINH